MAKCIKCNVNITDNTTVCPLCQRVLEPIPGEQLVNTYPNVARMRKKMAIALRIYGFCAIVTEVLLVIFNLTLPHDTYWCLLTGGAFLYGFLTLLFSGQKNRGFRLKILFQVLCGILFLISIDTIVGYTGWSINYVIPGTIVGLNALVIILMLVNKQNWQSYILIQIFLIACSVVPFILKLLNMNIDMIPAWASLFVSAVCFLGTVLIGGRTAQTELSRRFHV